VPCVAPGVTSPLAVPTVAIPVVPPLQLPPVEVSVSVIVDPFAQSGVLPPIGAGLAFMVTTVVVVPQLLVYEMVVVPCATPVTMPLVLPTVAFAVLLLLHVPPAALQLSVVVLLTQTEVIPDILAGVALTVTMAVAADAQPVYVIIAVPCVEPGVTTPVLAPTVAIPAVPPLQVPPVDDCVSVIVEPLAHMAEFPPIAAGLAFIVTTVVAVPQLLV
jgi:hypothetical protein